MRRVLIAPAALASALLCGGCSQSSVEVEIDGDFVLQIDFETPALQSEVGRIDIHTYLDSSRADCATLVSEGLTSSVPQPDHVSSYDLARGGGDPMPAIPEGLTPAFLVEGLDGSNQVVARGCVVASAIMAGADQRVMVTLRAVDGGGGVTPSPTFGMTPTPFPTLGVTPVPSPTASGCSTDFECAQGAYCAAAGCVQGTCGEDCGGRTCEAASCSGQTCDNGSSSCVDCTDWEFHCRYGDWCDWFEHRCEPASSDCPADTMRPIAHTWNSEMGLAPVAHLNTPVAGVGGAGCEVRSEVQIAYLDYGDDFPSNGDISLSDAVVLLDPDTGDTHSPTEGPEIFATDTPNQGTLTFVWCSPRSDIDKVWIVYLKDSSDNYGSHTCFRILNPG